MTSSDDEFDGGRQRPKSKRQREVREMAEYLAAKDGGEVDHWMAEANRITPFDEAPFRDDDLTNRGFIVSKTYDYTNHENKFLYQVVRYVHPLVPGAKEFRQRRHKRGGDVNWVGDAGKIKVPYRWPQLIARPDEPVFFTEGEKDADRLEALGLVATTLAGQKWSITAAKALRGRHVIVLVDNDDSGRDHAIETEKNLQGFAASIRVVALPGLQRTEDVSDWLDAGHTKEELLQIVQATRAQGVGAMPFVWKDPTTLPKRSWLYKPAYIRQFASLTISTTGVGKSSLVIAETLALVTGKPLLGITPEEGRRLRVWYWNGEDPIDELNRRFAAAMKYFRLTAEDIGDRLFVNSGRTLPLVIAEELKFKTDVNAACVQAMSKTCIDNKIDVVIIDPFVTCHRVNENNNAGIELVAKSFTHIAEVTNCAVMLVHHSKKTGGEAATVEDGRGASALAAAARQTRTVNTMAKKEAEPAKINEAQRRFYFRADYGNSNLTPPAEVADWFRLESVDLGNCGDGEWDSGDHVGVVTAWQYPQASIQQITTADIIRAQAAVRAGGPWRFDAKSTAEPWVGIAVAAALRRDPSNSVEKKAIRELIDSWVAAGYLRVVLHPDANRKRRAYVEAGAEPAAVAPVPTTGAAAGDGIL